MEYCGAALCYNQTAIRLLRHRYDAALDFAAIVHPNGPEFDAKRVRHRSNSGELADARGRNWIAKYRSQLNRWRYFLEQFEPFCAKAVLEIGKPGHIATGSRHVFHEAGADWISDLHEHDGYGTRRLPQGCHSRRASAHDDIGFGSNQFRCVFADIVRIASGPSIFDSKVAPFAPAEFL
jgi:hypothetical protein